MKKLLTILLIIPIFCFAQDDELKLDLGGFVDTYHAVRSSEPYDFMSSRSRLRAELEATKGKSYMFASVNAMYNAILKEQTGIELRESFFQYTTDNWDFKAGRQIVIWGIADGMGITDIVSPMDMTEFLARDYDDIRIPVNAFKLKYFNSKMFAEAIYIPLSSYYIVPTSPNNPWSMIPYQEGINYQSNLNNHPEKTLKNGEFGGRLSFFLSGIDFTICGLHTWNKMPILDYGMSAATDTVFVNGQYNRMDMLGADFSIPISQFVVRAEYATYFGELQQTTQQSTTNNQQLKRNQATFY